MAARTRPRRFLACLALLLLWPFLHLQAQEPSPSTRLAAPYTLHVYEDLVQLPLLVLTPEGKPYPGLATTQFTLRLDSGPPFHPLHTRLEGDEPLQLAIMLDAGQENTRLLAQHLAASLATATPGSSLGLSLEPHDQVSVYALDCRLVRTAYALPASAFRLGAWLTSALASTDLHRPEAAATCGDRRRLWQSVGTVVAHMSQLPGRRVVLLLSDGYDDAHASTWHTLALFAGSRNTTLMGLRPAGNHPQPADPADRLLPFALPKSVFTRTDENHFDLLCGETGGLVLPIENDTTVPQLNRALDLLRHRYILEFARPRNDTPGLHHVDATVPDRRAFVLSAGVGFPPRNSRQDAAPDTVPPDPEHAPQLGDRKPMANPQ